MRIITEEAAISLLKKYSKDKDSFKKVLEHAKAVRKVALRIAKKIPNVDKHLISVGCLLHDIGRFGYWKKNPAIHGVRGAEILRKEGLNQYSYIAERHLGAGISKEDIKEQGLDLPLNDYIPVTKEEKIIAHADNLIKGDKEISAQEAIERFRQELGIKVANKIKKLAQEVEDMEVK
jgi:uncharacterized protein (TIGR00295 family)